MTIYAFPSAGNEITKKSLFWEHTKVWASSLIAAALVWKALVACPIIAAAGKTVTAEGAAAIVGSSASTAAASGKILTAVSSLTSAEASVLLHAAGIVAIKGPKIFSSHEKAID